MADTDELYTLKNAFYLGNYQEAIAEAGTLRLKSDALRLERDVIVQRSYVGLGQYSKVISEVSSSSPVALQAVKALAQYLSEPSSRNSVVSQIDAWMQDVNAAGSTAVQAVAATVYIHEGSFQQALRAIRSFATLEALALSVQVYLRIDRVDLAEKQLKTMQERDDESSLYQLSAAQVCLALGGDRYREAVSLYQEMLARYGEDSVGVTNGLAASYVCLKKFDDAERILNEALAKDPSNPETLINLLAVLQHTGRGVSEAAARHLATLKKTAPGHPFVAALNLAESSFDRVAASFSA